MHGPRNPTGPIGDAQDLVRTDLGSYIRYQEYDDGWMYEISVPVSHDRLVTWRETLRIMVGGHLLSSYEEDGQRFLGFWITRENHDSLYPYGPLPFQYFDENQMAELRSVTDKWLAHTAPPPPETPALRIAI